MTIQDFIRETAGMPAATEILIADWHGNLTAAALLTREDLHKDDPLLDIFPANAIAILDAAQD